MDFYQTLQESNKLIAVPMEQVRKVVDEAFPFLHDACDIDKALAFESIFRARHGWRVKFPHRMVGPPVWSRKPVRLQAIHGARRPAEGGPPREEGVELGNRRRARLTVERSGVRFNWVWLTT